MYSDARDSPFEKMNSDITARYASRNIVEQYHVHVQAFEQGLEGINLILVDRTEAIQTQRNAMQSTKRAKMKCAVPSKQSNSQ